MPDLEAFVQGQNIVYKNLTILLSLFLILAFGVYVSYILNEKKNYPIRLSENIFDDFLNNSNINIPTDKKVINNVTVAEIKSLESFSDISYCPLDQCVVNLTTGVKKCPNNIDTNTSNVANRTGVAYTPGLDICVLPNKCPPSLPFAIKSNGEALTDTCDLGENCYCTATPQCATSVVKYFQNTSNGVPLNISEATKNYSFSTDGEKKDSNLLNNITLSGTSVSLTQFCKLNPAFTDRIIDGCDFTNRWNDPTNCQNTNIAVEYTLSGIDFNVTSYVLTVEIFSIINFNPSSVNFDYFPIESTFLGVEYNVTGSDNITPENLKETFSRGGSFSLDSLEYNFQSVEIISKFILFKEISRVKDGFLGLAEEIDPEKDNPVKISQINFTNCEGNNNDNVNYKNMLNCVQPFNQPCTEGTLAYNVDNISAREFCLGSGVSLVLGQNTPIEDFFLINPAYYTTSCVIGSGCDASIDTSLCASGTDCTNAFLEKTNKLFPRADFSALTNNFSVQPSSFGLSFEPTVTNNNGTYTIKNNLVPLENGDYWISNESFSDIFLTSNAISGTNILNVNNSLGITEGMSVNLSRSFKVIGNPIGTSVFLSSNLNSFDAVLAKTNYPLIFYQNNSNYGIVGDVTNFFNSQTFCLYSSDFTKLTDIDFVNNGLTFYKQFGFNGLNYNTVYNFSQGSRSFSGDYYYNHFKNILGQNFDITPPFTIYELTGTSKKEGLLNKNANFKQTYSMYYPVFNEDTFRQECVFCSPSLHVDVYVDDNSGGVSGINIQFSGQNYYHYAYGITPVSSNFNYNYISFGLTARDIIRGISLSSTNVIVLNSPLNNIKVGDFVIDEDGFLEKSLVTNIEGITSFASVKTPSLKNNAFILADIAYYPFILNGREFLANDGNNFTIPSDNTSNVFYGKTFIDDAGDHYYIKPLVKIIDISSDRKTITTNSSSAIPLKEKKVIQFISSTEILEVDAVQDPQDIDKALGSGAKISINSITQGRISSLKIDNPGSGYNSLNKPLVYISKYLPNDTLFQIS